MDELIFLAVVCVGMMLLGFIGFFVAVSANGKANRLAAQLYKMENMLAGLQSGKTAPQPAPQQITPLVDETPRAAEPDPVVAKEVPEPIQPAPKPEPLPKAAFTAEPKPEPKPRKPAMGLEEKLGTRWTVWIGGLALALGGIFVVRYSIESGWFGPAARIAGGALFATGLIAFGEWLRRREITSAIIGVPSAHIPGIITAAGTVSAFATVYAAYALYGFIGPAIAFILLGMVALATMAAAALHGPALAALGLIGALVSPVLVSTGKAQFWPVVIYLICVIGAAYGLGWLRRWRWLVLSSAAGALIWGFIFLAANRGDITPAIGHLIIQFAMAAGILLVLPYNNRRHEHGPIDFIACITLSLFACLAILIGSDGLIGAARVPMAGAISFGLLYLAWRYTQAVPLVATALLTVFGTLLLWRNLGALSEDPLVALTADPMIRDNLTAFQSFAVGSGIILAAAGYFKIGRDYIADWKHSLWFIASATAGPLALLLLSYWRVTQFDQSLPFAMVSGLVALAFTFATIRLRQLPSTAALDTPSLAVGAAASAAVAGVALGLTMALDKGVLTVALALTAFGVAIIAEKIALPVLRYVVAALGLVTLGRLIWNPMVVSGPIGTWPIINWLLWGYGVPALSFLASARMLERQGRDRAIRLIEGLGFVFATFLVYFEIRHLVTGGILEQYTSPMEAGLLATASLSFAILMTHLRQRGDQRFYDGAANIYRVLSLIGILVTLITKNPYLTATPVLGGAFLNELLPAYLLPALLAGILAQKSRGLVPLMIVRATAVAALALFTAYILLQIRLFFHLHEGVEDGSPFSFIYYGLTISEAEHWCYSLALLAIGIALLAIGLVRDYLSARIAALVYLVTVTAKVFIFDLANLAGLVRGLSFIGLGLVLVAIGYAYQNSRFGKRNRISDGESAP